MGSPLLALPGAVTDEQGTAPAHYGNPLGEQRQLAEGRAFVHLGDRAVLEVSGADRLTWLDTITSQRLTGLAAGHGTELLVLDPHGHVEHAAAVVDDGETAWLIVDADDVAGLGAWLRRMVFRAAVTITDRPDLVVIGRSGPEASPARDAVAAAAAGAPTPAWTDPWTGVELGGHQYAPAADHPGMHRPWVETIVPEDTLSALADAVRAAAVSPAGLLAAEALRIAAWRPRWAAELDERTLPHELDWLRTAVHLNKGCYRGQETVAKVHNLGHPPRRLVFLHLDGSDSVLPARGADVLRDDTVVGRVTSAALHHELGPIALAVVKRTLPTDAAVVVAAEDERIAAAQEVIVPPEAGAAASVPRLPRLSSRARA
jgi:folate-binding protein YgfZ